MSLQTRSQSQSQIHLCDRRMAMAGAKAAMGMQISRLVLMRSWLLSRRIVSDEARGAARHGAKAKGEAGQESDGEGRDGTDDG